MYTQAWDKSSFANRAAAAAAAPGSLMELSHASTPSTFDTLPSPPQSTPDSLATGASATTASSGFNYSLFPSFGRGVNLFPQAAPFIAGCEFDSPQQLQPAPAAPLTFSNSSLLFDVSPDKSHRPYQQPPPASAPEQLPLSSTAYRPGLFSRASPSLHPGQESELYGPASFQNGGAIMVPPSRESGEPSLQNPKQSKQQEVLMLADLGQLPLPAMENWDPKQKMFWLKCMLTKHLHQPCPSELPERVQKLRMVEACIRAQPNTQLESYISIFGEIFDKRIALKLQYELDAWKQVCDSIPVKMTHASYLAASPEKIGGDHLWEHILRLLMNEDPTVEWLAIHEGLFRFVDSSGAARSWGMTKGNMNMSYEKMSRSIRQYYTDDKNGLIQKATEYPKLHYRFNMFHPEVVSFLKKNFNEVCQRHAFLCSVVSTLP